MVEVTRHYGLSASNRTGHLLEDFSTRDITSEQNGYYDCQTLVPFNSILHVPGGEDYLAKMVTHNPDGSYTVKFPGYAKPIHLTAQDLKDPKLASVIASTVPGHENLLPALEAAWLKVHAAEKSVVDPHQLLLGKGTPVYGFPAEALSSPFAVNLMSQNNGQVIVTAARDTGKDPQEPVTVTTLDHPPKQIEILDGHAYNLSREPDGTYTISDPYHSGVKIPLSAEQASHAFTQIYASPAPGTKFTFPPELQQIAAASAAYGHAVFDEYAQHGPNSVDGNDVPNGRDPHAVQVVNQTLGTLNTALGLPPAQAPENKPPEITLPSMNDPNWTFTTPDIQVSAPGEKPVTPPKPIKPNHPSIKLPQGTDIQFGSETLMIDSQREALKKGLEAYIHEHYPNAKVVQTDIMADVDAYRKDPQKGKIVLTVDGKPEEITNGQIKLPKQENDLLNLIDKVKPKVHTELKSGM